MNPLYPDVEPHDEGMLNVDDGNLVYWEVVGNPAGKAAVVRGPATVGTAFSSTGTIPMSSRRWEDHSTVTVADRARAFEFTTEAKAGERQAMTARYRHRYEITPEAGGSRVTYTLTQLAIANPMLRMALPGVRQLTWRMAIPMFASRGLRNLVTFAEERAAPAEAPLLSANVTGGHMHTEEI